jgi:hypothetical protein
VDNFIFLVVGYYLVPVSIIPIDISHLMQKTPLIICPLRKPHCTQAARYAFLSPTVTDIPLPLTVYRSYHSSRIMPAISLATRDQTMHQLVRRGNWASHNAGVVLVFCIVFIVAVGLASLFIYRKWAARKAAK